MGSSVDEPYPPGYTSGVYQIRQSGVFSAWIATLADKRAKARILARLDSVRLGNLRDTRSLGAGLHEFRVHVGPGYRVYFAPQQKFTLAILCGGDKSTQSRDIARARRLLGELDTKE